MSTLTIGLKQIESLKQIQKKLVTHEPLTSSETFLIENLLRSLPSSRELLNAKYPTDHSFEVQVFDFDRMVSHLEKWCNLFNNLPKNGTSFYPNAGWFDANEDHDFWKRNVIIEVSFIPSLEYYKRKEEKNKIVGLDLKADGTALFDLLFIEDAEYYPDLYAFRGTWKEAYLLTVKTLKEGWPQTEFPQEFEQFLKKE